MSKIYSLRKENLKNRQTISFGKQIAVYKELMLYVHL
jgi:hypothetical protein